MPTKGNLKPKEWTKKDKEDKMIAIVKSKILPEEPINITDKHKEKSTLEIYLKMIMISNLNKENATEEHSKRIDEVTKRLLKESIPRFKNSTIKHDQKTKMFYPHLPTLRIANDIISNRKFIHDRGNYELGNPFRPKPN